MLKLNMHIFPCLKLFSAKYKQNVQSTNRNWHKIQTEWSTKLINMVICTIRKLALKQWESNVLFNEHDRKNCNLEFI